MAPHSQLARAPLFGSAVNEHERRRRLTHLLPPRLEQPLNAHLDAPIVEVPPVPDERSPLRIARRAREHLQEPQRVAVLARGGRRIGGGGARAGGGRGRRDEGGGERGGGKAGEEGEEVAWGEGPAQGEEYLEGCVRSAASISSPSCTRCSTTQRAKGETDAPSSASPLSTAFRPASSPSPMRSKSPTCRAARGSRSSSSLASGVRPRRNATRARSALESGVTVVCAVVVGPAAAVAAVPAAVEEVGGDDDAEADSDSSLSTMSAHTSSSLVGVAGPLPPAVAAALPGADAAMSCAAQCLTTGLGDRPRKAEMRSARRCALSETSWAMRTEGGREWNLRASRGCQQLC